MPLRIPKLTIRDLLWMMLLAAVAIGWWIERQRAVKQLAGYGARAGGSSQVQKSPEWFKRNSLLVQLRNLNNHQLLQHFQQKSIQDGLTPYGATNEYQTCLLEMARRGMHTELQAEYDKLKFEMEQQQLRNVRDMLPSREIANAWLLTALRRAEGKPDPLQLDVEVQIVTDKEAPAKSNPEVRVNIRNVDTEAINLTQGGDYRSGRQTRFRIQLTNEKGFRIPDANFSLFGPGGGISSFGPVGPNEHVYKNPEYRPTLDARKYVSPPSSGLYQLQVIYAEQEIAEEPDVDGLIVWQSNPLTVQVENQMRDNEQRISLAPLISMLALLVAAHRAFERWRESRAPREQFSAQPWFNWRDLVAVVVLIGLIYGYFTNMHELNALVERNRPWDKADWTMKIVEPTSSTPNN